MATMKKILIEKYPITFEDVMPFDEIEWDYENNGMHIQRRYVVLDDGMKIINERAFNSHTGVPIRHYHDRAVEAMDYSQSFYELNDKLGKYGGVVFGYIHGDNKVDFVDSPVQFNKSKTAGEDAYRNKELAVKRTHDKWKLEQFYDEYGKLKARKVNPRKARVRKQKKEIGDNFSDLI